MWWIRIVDASTNAETLNSLGRLSWGTNLGSKDGVMAVHAKFDVVEFAGNHKCRKVMALYGDDIYALAFGCVPESEAT